MNQTTKRTHSRPDPLYDVEDSQLQNYTHSPFTFGSPQQLQVRLEEIHEFIIHQLVVSYNLYKVVSKHDQIIENLNNTIKNLQTLPNRIEDILSNPSKKSSSSSTSILLYVILAIQLLNFLLSFFLILKVLL